MATSGVRSAVVVFTRDIRVHDNPALMAACANAEAVVPLFVLDDSIIDAASPNRLGFLVDSLRDLDQSLRRCGVPLVVRRGRWVDEIMAVASQTAADSIHIADDVSSYAKLRLERLRRVAERGRVAVEIHPGVTVVPPGWLRPRSGRARYELFSPYHRSWVDASWRPILPAPRGVGVLESVPLPGFEVLDSVECGGRSRQVIGGGETAARRRLDEFVTDQLERYDDRRNVLAADATSRISAFLHFGCLSPVEAATRVRALPNGDSFLRQLCWRDFFHQVLAARPESASSDYRDRGHRWSVDEYGYEAWCTGRTGFPVIDAAMRQLVDEGFMHNRARMVVASFLSKDLYIDWRLGAAHFMSLLVDADVANNQLNWQWVAGTGTDTNPNRVFNPVLQGRRFDPAGDYIRQYLPELAELDDSAIHWPDVETRRRIGYPLPIIDHREAMRSYRSQVQAGR
jgi:deoxyribodipyrimidine photo-lyase